MGPSLRSALFAQINGRVCASSVDETVAGWGTHKDQVSLLPVAEQARIAKLADLVVTSFTMTGCVPLGQITVTGHADHDA